MTKEYQLVTFDTSPYKVQSPDSALVRLTEQANNLPEVQEYGVHRWLWHHNDPDTRDLYRAMHRTTVKIKERAIGDTDDLGGIGMYIDAEEPDCIDIALVGPECVLLQETILYSYVYQMH